MFYHHPTFNPDWISAMVAALALLFAVYEYYFRRRPYLKMEIDVQERQGCLFFIGRIVNFGNTPAYFWLKKEEIEIKIGDEVYFAANSPSGYSFPNEKQPPFIELGNINENGISKLLNNKYKDNTAHLNVVLRYKLKWLSYKFHAKYGLKFSDGTNGTPRVTVFVISQEFI